MRAINEFKRVPKKKPNERAAAENSIRAAAIAKRFVWSRQSARASSQYSTKYMTLDRICIYIYNELLRVGAICWPGVCIEKLLHRLCKSRRMSRGRTRVMRLLKRPNQRGIVLQYIGHLLPADVDYCYGCGMRVVFFVAFFNRVLTMVIGSRIFALILIYVQSAFFK